VTEAADPAGRLYGAPRLAATLEGSRTTSLEASVPALLADVLRWSGGASPEDDVSILALEYVGAREEVTVGSLTPGVTAFCG
jgi:hypothetical protein